jgi:hypothetical protein
MSTITSWTRERLEAEARRRGIDNPESLPRSELIRLLIRQGGKEGLQQALRVPGVKTAGDLLGAAIDAASSAVPEQLETLRNISQKLPEVVRRISSFPPRPPASGEASSPFSPPPEASSPFSPAPEASSPFSPPPEASSPFSPAPEASSPFSPSPLDSGADTDGAVVSSPAQSSLDQDEPREPITRRYYDEPHRTRTMARILAAQGHRERALDVYDELVADNPEDQTLQLEQEKVRRGEPLKNDSVLLSYSSRSESEPAAEQQPLPDTDSRIRCEAMGPAGLTVSWNVTSGELHRARSFLSRPGQLFVRIISIAPDDTRRVRSEIVEHGPVKSSGKWTAQELDDALQEPADVRRRFAAVGLLSADQRFVSIAHAAI